MDIYHHQDNDQLFLNSDFHGEDCFCWNKQHVWFSILTRKFSELKGIETCFIHLLLELNHCQHWI